MNKHIDEVIHAIVSRITNVARLWSRNSARDNSEDWTKIVKIRDISEHSASKNSSVSLELAREQSLAPALRSGWMKRKYGGQKLLRFLGQCINIKITFADGQMGYTSYDAAEENFVHLLLFKNRHSSSSSSSSLLARRVAPRVLSLPEIEFVRERERERERDSGSFD